VIQTAVDQGVAFDRHVADAVPFELVIFDSSGQIRWANAAWDRLTEHRVFSDATPSVLTNYFDAFYSVTHGRAGQQEFSRIVDFVRLTDERVAMNYQIRIRGGRWFHVHLQSLAIDGEPLLLATHVDISDQKQREDFIRQLADVDGLTNLTNRRGLDAFLTNEFNRAQRIGHPVSLLLIDVDLFKTYNDRYGHLAGDDALRALARALNRFGRRPTDLVARYGGEEFAIVLGDTDRKGALAMARRVHRAVVRLHLPFPEGPDGRISVSVGAATIYPDRSSRPDGLIALADTALYTAKTEGRDRVVAASEGRQTPR